MDVSRIAQIRGLKSSVDSTITDLERFSSVVGEQFPGTHALEAPSHGEPWSRRLASAEKTISQLAEAYTAIAESLRDAQEALSTNGFSRFAGDEHLQSFLAPPLPPFHEGRHPNGKIYSSGRFWKSAGASLSRKRTRATVIVRVEDAILLVVTRHKLVLLPGGGLSKGELPIVGAARELHEETGLVAISLSYFFQYESESNLHHVFLAEATGNPVAGDDAVRLEYLTGLASDSVLNLSPATRTILAKFQELEASPA